MKEKNENLSTEEKMIKNFDKSKTMINALQILMIVAIIFFVISFINALVQVKFDTSKIKDIILDIIEYDKNDFIEYSKETKGLSDGLKMSQSLYENLAIISVIVRGISLYTIAQLLSNILSDSIKQKTPFVEKNINRVRLIAICSIFYSYRIVYFIIIIIVNQLFKYGYKLQVESDELL